MIAKCSKIIVGVVDETFFEPPYAPHFGTWM